MTPQQHLDHIAAESAHFASAIAGSSEQKIGHLNDWTVRDLAAHLGGVYAFVTANVEKPGTERNATGDEATAPTGDAINDWFAERRTTLLTTLSSADPGLPMWTFAGMKTVDWWKRRMAAKPVSIGGTPKLESVAWTLPIQSTVIWRPTESTNTSM